MFKQVLLENLEVEFDAALVEESLPCPVIVVGSVAFADMRMGAHKIKNYPAKECLNVTEMVLWHDSSFIVQTGTNDGIKGQFLGLVWGTVPILCSRFVDRDGVFIASLMSSKYKELIERIRI